MTRSLKSKSIILILAVGVVAWLSAQIVAQETTANPPKQAVGQQTATMTASLVNASESAKTKSATVDVQVSGVELVDPAIAGKMAKAGQGHLHYRVDSGPIIATTATKLSFHELSPGKHQIMVMLAANDHTPLGPQQMLEITIP